MRTVRRRAQWAVLGRRLIAPALLATMSLSGGVAGCSAACHRTENTDTEQTDEPVDVEFAGTWVYSGSHPDIVESQMTLTATAMDEQGTSTFGSWTTRGTIVEVDESLDHFLVEINGCEYCGMNLGDAMYATYRISGDTLAFYVTVNTGYPGGTGGAEGQDYWQYTRQ